MFPVVVSLNLWREKWFIDGKIILLYSPREVVMAVHLAVSFMIPLRSLEDVPSSRPFSNFQTNNKQQEMQRTFDVINPYAFVVNENGCVYYD